MSDVIDKIEGKKVWGWVALGGAIFAGTGIFLLVRESAAARKAAETKMLAEEQLKQVKDKTGDSPKDAESTSGCGGCSGVVGKEYPMKNSYNTESVMNQNTFSRNPAKANWQF